LPLAIYTHVAPQRNRLTIILGNISFLALTRSGYTSATSGGIAPTIIIASDGTTLWHVGEDSTGVERVDLDFVTKSFCVEFFLDTSDSADQGSFTDGISKGAYIVDGSRSGSNVDDDASLPRLHQGKDLQH